MKIVNSGSDRNFIILKNKVLLIDPTPNLEKYIKISNFLRKKNINVPRIYKKYRSFAIIQNIGTPIYYEIKKNNKTCNWIIKKYSLITTELIKIHNIDNLDQSIFKFFDLKTIKWEWNYFIENYLLNYMGINNTYKWYLASEKIINTCYNIFKICKNLIHRDLQSTNIIFFKRKPYFIDFQGMMIGNFMYDLASLLEDPYVMLPQYVKEKILDNYFKNQKHLQHFGRYYKYYSIQRLVQVLGAFAFLSIHKNKPFFIQNLKNSQKIFLSIKQSLLQT